MGEPAKIEPWLAELLDASEPAFLSALSAEDRAWIRETITAELQEDPALAALVRRARPRAVPDISGTTVPVLAEDERTASEK
jgi:hypothetical protein